MIKIIKYILDQIKLCIGDFYILLYVIGHYFLRNCCFGIIYYPISNKKKILILGNDPSLIRDIGGKDISEYDLMAVNFSTNDSLFFNIRPKLLVLTDNAFWNFPLASGLQQKIKIMQDNLKDKVDWNLTIYIPYQAKKGFDYFSNVNPKISITYYNLTSCMIGHRFLRYFFYDQKILMPIAQICSQMKLNI